MPASINDPEHRRQRAEQMRALAVEMGDPQARQTMLQLARDYERLAERAVQRAGDLLPDPRPNK